MVGVTPVYSGDTAAVGELAEETPTEWTERAGEKDSGDGEVGVVSVNVNSSSLSAERIDTSQKKQFFRLKDPKNSAQKKTALLMRLISLYHLYK